MNFDIQSRHRNEALRTYGHKCEWIGCGWDAAMCDVHHIDYHAYWHYQERARKAIINGNMEKLATTFAEARDKGFLSFNSHARSLSKDDRIENLAVLCPNHHRYVHTHDMGLELLKVIPPRKTSV